MKIQEKKKMILITSRPSKDAPMIDSPDLT